MINAPPPDPTASLDAELRSEDDGMPEHPAKAADPVSWAEEYEEREKLHTLGYPAHPLAQAWTDFSHRVSRYLDRLPPLPRTQIATLSTVAGVAAGLAVYMLYFRRSRY